MRKSVTVIAAGLAPALLLAFAALGAHAQDPAPPDGVQVLAAGGAVPEVALRDDGSGVLVYGRDGRGVARVRSDGAFGDETVFHDGGADDPVAMTAERGPKVALGEDDMVHVAWQAKRGRVLYVRSTDGGATWSDAVDLYDDGDTGHDMVLLAADGEGTVIVGWYDARLGKADHSPVGLPLFLRVSDDDGETFGESAKAETAYPGWFCSCCEIEAVCRDGDLIVSARGAYEGIRDMLVLRGPLPKPDKAWRAKGGPIATLGWRFEGCPMSGAGFFAGADGDDLAVAWKNEDELRFAVSRNGGGRWSKPVVLDGAAGGTTPAVARDGDGRWVVAWMQGRQVRWQRLDERARPDGARGSLEPSAPNTQPAVTVLPGGDVLILH